MDFFGTKDEKSTFSFCVGVWVGEYPRLFGKSFHKSKGRYAA